MKILTVIILSIFLFLFTDCSHKKVPAECVNTAKASFDKLKTKDIQGFKTFFPENQKKVHDEYLDADHNVFFRTVSDYKFFEDKFEYREGRYFVLTQFLYPENAQGAFFIALDSTISGKCYVDLSSTIAMEKKLHPDVMFTIFIKDDKAAKDQKLPPDVDPSQLPKK